jgi:hypothetical protein
MTELSCPLCGLKVAAATSQAAPDLTDCPRCLAGTGGALSVMLGPRPARANVPLQRRVAGLLRQLRPAAVKR